jgi:ribonuclease P protein component
MQVAGSFRVVRHKDHIVFDRQLKSLSTRGSLLDIRVLFWGKGKLPFLLVSASKKTGSAVERNKFRRRVRMAFLAVLRKHKTVFDMSFALFIRPARWNPTGCRIGYQDIEKQIESALNRLRHQ